MSVFNKVVKRFEKELTNLIPSVADFFEDFVPAVL